jgi:hypothetical protein
MDKNKRMKADHAAGCLHFPVIRFNEIKEIWLKVVARHKAAYAARVLGSLSVLSNSPFVDDANASGSSMR